MTLQEAKDQIAREFEYQDWEDLQEFYIRTRQPETLVKRADQAAELYARSKWDEACQAQKKICSDDLNHWEFGGRSSVHHFNISPNAEFKP